MIERSSNVPPEAIVHSNTDLNLPEHYEAKVATDGSLPELYKPTYSQDYGSTERIIALHDLEADGRIAQEKQTYNVNEFSADNGDVKLVENPKRYFGLRPKVFFVCFAGLLLAIVAAAVGGGVGSAMSNKNHKDASLSTNGGNSQSTGTTTAVDSSSTSGSNSAGNGTSPEGNTTEPIRGLAATEINKNIMLTHQDAAGDLYYLPYYSDGGGWKEKEKITLKSPAMLNTSLASACWNNSDIIAIRTYYIATNSLLQEITFTCYTNGTDCATKSGAMSGNIKLSANAGLAAVATAASTIRIFTLDDEGNVSEIQYNPGSGWDSLTSIGNAQADPASPLAVVVSGTVIYLFWFTSGGALQLSKFTSSWSSPATLATVSSIPASLTAALSQSPDHIQVFYPNGTGFQEVKYSSGVWDSAADSTLPASSMTDGPVAAVAWNGTTATRAYYIADGSFQEVQPDGGNEWKSTSGWKASFLEY